MADVLAGVLEDLRAESEDLDVRVADLDADGWATPTPAEGWTIADTVGHLHWTDLVSVTATRGAEAFQAEVAALGERHGADAVDAAAHEHGARPPAELLPAWRDGRAALDAALRDVPAGEKLPWFGPPMSPASMATARLMETWAHGQDVADALGQVREPTDRIRHVAHLAVRTRGFAYAVNGMDVPDEPVRVVLTSPSGEEWDFGPDGATQSITGPALDLCLLAVQRRHRDDLALVADGPAAQEWLGIVQAFAGPPGGGRAPLSA